MTRFLYLSFIALIFTLSIFSYLYIDPNFSYLNFIYTGFFLNHREVVALIFFVLITTLFLFYFLIIKEAYKKNISWRRLKTIFFISALILIFAYPAMVSYDIFNYTTTAKVLFGYHENPYIVMPVEFSGEHFLKYTHAANKTALYAPFWILLTALPYVFGSVNFLFMILGFKLLVSVFYILSLVLIYKITKDALSVAFIALNPLVLFETFLGGHNDIVMISLALLSLFLLKKEKSIFSGISILLSVLIKFATIFLFPVYVYVFWMRLRKKLISWERIYLLCAFFMSLVFFLSPIREEIYPWYFIWILPFISLTKSIKLYFLTGIFSLFLMYRYLPYMFLGTYFGITPYIKIGITFGPLFLLVGIFTYLSLVPHKK